MSDGTPKLTPEEAEVLSWIVDHESRALSQGYADRFVWLSDLPDNLWSKPSLWIALRGLDIKGCIEVRVLESRAGAGGSYRPWYSPAAESDSWRHLLARSGRIRESRQQARRYREKHPCSRKPLCENLGLVLDVQVRSTEPGEVVLNDARQPPKRRRKGQKRQQRKRLIRTEPNAEMMEAYKAHKEHGLVYREIAKQLSEKRKKRGERSVSHETVRSWVRRTGNYLGDNARSKRARQTLPTDGDEQPSITRDRAPGLTAHHRVKPR